MNQNKLLGSAIANKSNYSGNLTPLVILLMAVLVFLLPSVSANLGTYDVNDCVNIVTNLNASNVNISVITSPSPSSVVMYSNQIMTKTGNLFNYTFCNTSKLGVYTYGYCDYAGNCYSNDFRIGKDLSISQSIIYFIFLLAAVSIFAFALYYAIKLPYKNVRDEDGFTISVNNLKYVKVLLIGGCYLIALMIIGLLRGITENFVPEIGVSKFFEMFFWILLSFLYPLMIGGLIFLLVIFLTDRKLTKALERGIPV